MIVVYCGFLFLLQPELAISVHGLDEGDPRPHTPFFNPCSIRSSCHGLQSQQRTDTKRNLFSLRFHTMKVELETTGDYWAAGAQKIIVDLARDQPRPYA